MKKKLGILAIVDQTGFLEEMCRELQRAGLSFEVRHVESREQFMYELRYHRPEVILSNQGLPSFSGAMAQAAAREQCPEVPFIFVTAARPEESACAAADSLPSTLSTLGRTVRRAVRQAQIEAKLRVLTLQTLTARWLG